MDILKESSEGIEIDNKRKALSGIDFMKIAMTILVVCIHVKPLEGINNEADFVLVNIISRIAVPFFFVASGYLFASNVLAKGEGYWSKYIKRMMGMFLKWNIIYIPIGLIQLTQLQEKAVYTKASNMIGSMGIIEKIFRGIESFFVYGIGYHLWYITAAIFAVSVIYFLAKKIRLERIWFLSLGLYAFGCTEVYYGIIQKLIGEGVLRNIIDAYFTRFITTRNGLFMAMIFVCMGMVIQKKNKDIKGAGWKFLFFFIILVIESISLKKVGGAIDYNFYMSLVPLTYFLFGIAKRLKFKDSIMIRELSVYARHIYFVHVGVLVLAPYFLRVLNLEEIWTFGIFRLQFVLIVSLTISHLIINGRRISKGSEIRYRKLEEKRV